MFSNLGIQFIYVHKYSQRNLLGNPKNKTESFKSRENMNTIIMTANGKYCGKSGRAIKTRCGEQLAHLKYGRI